MRSQNLFIHLLLISILLFMAGTGVLSENILSVPDSSYNIGIIPSGSSSPFHQELIHAANKTASERNWTVIILTPDEETNISFQEDAMNTLISGDVDLICLNTLDTDKLADEIQEAESAKIPVFLYNTLVPAKTQNITEYIGYDQYTGAYTMGVYAARTLTDLKNETQETVQGRAFILRGLPGFHADQRTAGFIDGLSTSPGIEIVGEQVAGWDRETARSITKDVLKEDPAIDIFYGNSDEMAIGAALAVQEFGKKVNDEILCLGIDGNMPTLEMIRNKTMTATLGVYPEKIGETLIIQAKKVLDGESVPIYLETPAVVIDSANLDAYLNGSLWTEPVSSEPEQS
ncbi:sugar ABC transporter substrate-binding protein [Methanospirillum sp.]